MPISGSDPIDAKSGLTATFAMGANGTIIFVILPILLGAGADELGLAESDIGYLSGAYYGAYLVTTITSMLWVRKIDWRILGATGSALTAVGLAVPVFGLSFPSLVAGLAIAGLGAGIVFALSLCAASDMQDPDRKFAIKISVESLYGALILFILPAAVLAQFGILAFLGVLAAVTAIIGIFAVLFPAGSRARELPETSSGIPADDRLALAGLFCLMLYFGAGVSVYVFLERIGQLQGVDVVTIGVLLGLSAVSGIVGPAIAALLGDRLGRVFPQVIGTGFLFLCLILLALSLGLNGYGAAVILLPGAWYFALAYQNGIIASADVRGRYALLISAAYAIGATVGPTLAGGVIEAYGYETLFVICGAGFVLAVIGFAYIVPRIGAVGAPANARAI